MNCLMEMPGWITYNGPTQDNWNLLWYQDRVVARFMGENFTDFIMRNQPIVPGGLAEPGEKRLHPKSFNVDITQISKITFIRRRLIMLPQLLFEGDNKKISFYTRDKSKAPMEMFKKLKEIFPGTAVLAIR